MKLTVSPVKADGNIMQSASITVESMLLDHVVNIAIISAQYLTAEWYTMPIRISVGLIDNGENVNVELAVLSNGFDPELARERIMSLYHVAKTNLVFQ